MARRLPLTVVAAAIFAAVGVGAAIPASAAGAEFNWAAVTQACTTTTGESVIKFSIEPSAEAIPERGEISAASYDLVGGNVVRVSAMPEPGSPFGNYGQAPGGDPAAQGGELTVAGSPSSITFTVSIRWDDYLGAGPHAVTTSYRLDLSPCQPRPGYEWTPHCGGGGELFLFNDPTAGGSVNFEVFGAGGYYRGGMTAYTGGVAMVVPKSAATNIVIKANGVVIGEFAWVAPPDCTTTPTEQVGATGANVDTGTSDTIDQAGNAPAGTVSAMSIRTTEAGQIADGASTQSPLSAWLAIGGGLLGLVVVLSASAYLVVRQRRSRGQTTS